MKHRSQQRLWKPLCREPGKGDASLARCVSKQSAWWGMECNHCQSLSWLCALGPHMSLLRGCCVVGMWIRLLRNLYLLVRHRSLSLNVIYVGKHIWVSISYISEWPCIYYVAEDEFEFPLLSARITCLCHCAQFLAALGVEADFLQAKQILYQLRDSSSLLSMKLYNLHVILIR